LPEPGSPSLRRPPTMSRRHAAGTASARGLLFTLLGEFVLTEGGRAWTSAVIAAFARLGVEEKATRQALMRTAAAGWLTAEKSGRRTRWRLTGNAGRLLTEGAERIYSFTAAAENWDGRWLVISARIPESDRGTRHAVSRKLSWAGFGSIAPGLWVSPHAERETEAVLVLRDAIALSMTDGAPSRPKRHRATGIARFTR
jgi:phenylacetic acid degradation operon negative regulatory protein